MSNRIIVTKAFKIGKPAVHYRVGQEITDPTLISQLTQAKPHHVVRALSKHKPAPAPAPEVPAPAPAPAAPDAPKA